ncbi:MAG TPA: FG-GAP-like repeat-containing protein, partial [Tepidisphaeraceae bacterium]|nr:FG-GAP-like repeat-containing protein [Tepidisphaeraceae bacterium]
GDGDLDIASINETNGRIEFLKNSGSGTFGSYSTVSAANIRATNRRAVDIDNDGDLDLVAEFHDPATNARDYVLGVFYNEANGNFSAPRFDALPMNTLNWELTDFDGDEQPDLFVVGDVTNNGVTDVSVYVKSNRIDVTAPTVTASFERSIPATRFTFSENVFNSLTESDFQLRRLENSSTIPSSSLDLEFESATNSVLVHYTGSANGQLPDGHYEFSILANNTSDITGNTLASDFTFNFDVYAGDIDGDGIISFSELLIVAQNYGSQNATFEQGDLDYDGDVDFEDLLLVAQRYGTSLPQLRVVSELVRPTRSSIKQR